MTRSHLFIRRVFAAFGLAVAVVGAAALSGPAVGADPLKPLTIGGGTFTVAPISAIQVQAKGTEATLAFTTAEPTAVTVDHKPATAMTASSQPTRQSAAGAANASAKLPAITGQYELHRSYATTHQLKLTGLTSNTAYDVVVTAETRSGQKHTAQTRFTTLNKRVRITLESIDIKDDGDGIFTGNGEPIWSVDLTWTSSAGTSTAQHYCYPIPCTWGDFGEGRITPRNSAGELPAIIFAEQNFDHFPDSVSLGVTAQELDVVDAPLTRFWECLTSVVDGGCISGEETPTMWRVPQGVENASKRLMVRGDDTDTGFESVLTFHMEVFHDNTPYPAPRRNVPRSTWR